MARIFTRNRLWSNNGKHSALTCWPPQSEEISNYDNNRY